MEERFKPRSNEEILSHLEKIAAAAQETNEQSFDQIHALVESLDDDGLMRIISTYLDSTTPDTPQSTKDIKEKVYWLIGTHCDSCESCGPKWQKAISNAR